MITCNGIYRELLNSLEANGIYHVIIRDDVMSELHIKDLDILIDRSMREKFKKVAQENFFSPIKDGYLNPLKSVYLKMDNGEKFILDVHETLLFRGIEFMDPKKIIERSYKENGYYRLSNEDFLISLLFHNLLAKHQIQDKHREKILQLLQGPLDYSYTERHLRKFGLYNIFQQLTQNFSTACRDTAFVGRLARKAVLILLVRRPSNLVRVLTMHARRLTTKMWGRRRGILITFVGPDGAGKSTTIEAVEERLREVGFACKAVYLGPWGQNLLQFRKIFRWLNPSPYREDYEAYYNGERQEKPGPLTGVKRLKLQMRSTLYYVLLVVEMWTRWLVRVMPQLRQGKVVLADRYMYDILTGYKTRPMDYHVAIREWLCDRYPRPDFGIVLDSNPEAIFERKPQLNHIQLKEARTAYHNVAARYDFTILDTSVDVTETLNSFEVNILPKIISRMSYKKRI